MNKYMFIIVGVGGTGSLLARDIPKLLIDRLHQMVLIDGDNVERKNMVRQSYQEHDIDENKAIALSRKINTFYGLKCTAIDKFITRDELLLFINEQCKTFIPVLVGCVDNDKTRALLENTFKHLEECIYIDSANSEYEGNVYISVKSGNKQVGKLRSEVYELSNDIHPTEKSCEAQAARGNTQFLVTNLKMATVIIEHIHALLTKKVKAGVTNVRRFETIHYS